MGEGRVSSSGTARQSLTPPGAAVWVKVPSIQCAPQYGYFGQISCHLIVMFPQGLHSLLL